MSARAERHWHEAQSARMRGDGALYIQSLQAACDDGDHPKALNALGNHYLNTGDPNRGRALLKRAVACDPNAPQLWFNLSLAHRVAGDAPAEIDCLERALALDPYFLHAIIHLGAAFERTGALAQAVGYYRDALACAQAQPHIAATVPADLLNHARAGIETYAQTLDAQLADTLAAVRQRHGHGESARFAEMLDIFYGRKQHYTQKPTYLAFPGLPAIAFYERGDFPWLEAVEAHTAEIQSELASVLASQSDDFLPYITHAPGRPLGQWEELNHSPQWGAYHLILNGTEIADHTAQCPHTMAAIRQAPLAHIAGNGPNAFFSALKPNTRIPPHTGMTNARLVVHLPLIIPPSCGFRVGNTTRAWQAGQGWIFDDTIEHEAWNLSPSTRIILIFDIWNPLLSDLERDLICAFFEGLADSPHEGMRLSAGL